MSIPDSKNCEYCLVKSALPLYIAFFATLLLCSCITPPDSHPDTAHGVLEFVKKDCSCSGFEESEPLTTITEHKDISLHLRRAECIWIREYLKVRATMDYSANIPAELMPVRLKFHGFSTIRSRGKFIDIRRELQAAATYITIIAKKDGNARQCIIAEYNIDWMECNWVMGKYSFSDIKKAERMEGRDAVEHCIGIEPGDIIDMSVIFKCGERRRMDRWIHDDFMPSTFLRRKVKDKSACNITSGYLEIPFFDAEGQPLHQGELTFELDPEKRITKYWSNYMYVGN